MEVSVCAATPYTNEKELIFLYQQVLTSVTLHKQTLLLDSSGSPNQSVSFIFNTTFPYSLSTLLLYVRFMDLKMHRK